MKTHSPSPTRPPPLFRWATLALLGLLFLLHLATLGHEALWFDETLTLRIVQGGFSDILHYRFFHGHPPLFYLGNYCLYAPLDALGLPPFFSIRLFSVLLFFANAAALFLLAREAFDRPTAWLALLLLALCPVTYYYAQEARNYMTASFFILLTTTFLLRWFAAEPPKPEKPTSPTPRRQLALLSYTAAAIALAMSHVLGLFFLFSQGLIILTFAFFRRKTGFALRYIAVGLFIALFYIPWYIVFPSARLGANLKGPIDWIHHTAWSEPFLSFGTHLWWPMLPRLADLFSGFTLILTIILLYLALRHIFLRISIGTRPSIGPTFLVALLFLPAAIAISLTHLGTTVYNPPRFILLVTPILLILFSVALLSLPRRIMVLVSFLVAALFATSTGFLASTQQKGDFKAITPSVREINLPTCALFLPGFSVTLFEFYTGRKFAPPDSANCQDTFAVFAFKTWLLNPNRAEQKQLARLLDGADVQLIELSADTELLLVRKK